jgi:hypothetical protein
MNINSLFGSQATAPTSNVGAVNPSSAGVSSVPPPMGGAATAAISTPGQFLSQMQQLSQQNPTEFKAVAAQVATSFQKAASQATGPQAQFLTNLANQFSQAAQTGSLPTPPGAAQGAEAVSAGQAGGSAGAHHHPHHHGGGSAQFSDVQQAFQTAMSILSQATSGATPSATAPST